jgi:hypothetical protein
MVQKTRFFDELVSEYRLRVQHRVQEWRTYSQMVAMLEDYNTKRILFDARQAIVFDDLGEMNPEQRHKLHEPFSRFWLEFTEPVQLAEPEPGHPNDWTYGLLYHNTGATVKAPYQQEGGLPVATVTFFGKEPSELFTPHGEMIPKYFDRFFRFQTTSGLAVCTKQVCQATPEPSELPPEWDNHTAFFAGTHPAGWEYRHVGWWERVVQDYAALLTWMLAYLMAKGIRIEKEPVSRQVKRWHERRGLPLPWHVVSIEPKFVTRGGEAEESKWHHSFRYDVIGHLRFTEGRFIWVRPHQRGLANEIYIPKTYNVKGGKQVDPHMKRYFES